MTLKIVAPTIEEIQRILSELAQTRLESNAIGDLGRGSYDYDCVSSNDLYSNDRNARVINPVKLEIRVRKTPNAMHPYIATTKGVGTYGWGNTSAEARACLKRLLAIQT